jgi:hypothetical protein
VALRPNGSARPRRPLPSTSSTSGSKSTSASLRPANSPLRAPGWPRSPPLPPASGTGCATPCGGCPPSQQVSQERLQVGAARLLQPLAPSRQEGLCLADALQVGGQRALGAVLRLQVPPERAEQRTPRDGLGHAPERSAVISCSSVMRWTEGAREPR